MKTRSYVMQMAGIALDIAGSITQLVMVLAGSYAFINDRVAEASFAVLFAILIQLNNIDRTLRTIK